jgi:hypothetical protein
VVYIYLEKLSVTWSVDENPEGETRREKHKQDKL